MKQVVIFGLALFMVLGSLSCNAQNNKKAGSNTAVSPKVEVYYFHFTRRCHTCESVEANAKLAVEQMYADKIKAGDYSFKGINLDDASSKAIAEKLGVGGQTLLIVCGNNKVDITSQGFMNAQNLEKMKEEIKKAVEKATKG
jgi:hypothetical protein